MAQRTPPAFKVECPDCGLTHESDEFDETVEFADKHAEHTGHEVGWVRTAFQPDVDPLTEYVLECDVCDDEWTFDSYEDAQSFREEHGKYTDHSIENEPTEEPFKIHTDTDLRDEKEVKDLVSRLEEEFENGAPEQAIYASISDEPEQVARARTLVEKLRRKGEVYEPARGYLRTT